MKYLADEQSQEQVNTDINQIQSACCPDKIIGRELHFFIGKAKEGINYVTSPSPK